MRQSLHIFLIILCLTGCETGVGPASTGTANTLSANPLIPVHDLRNCFSTEGWDAIRNLEYDGYVIIRAFINSDKTLTVDKVVDSYPDDSRNALALKHADQVMLTPTRVGTNTTLHARIYAVFYENPPLPNKGIIFAQQYGVASTVSLGHQVYLRHFMY